MTVLRALGAALVRVLVVVALYAGFVAALDRSDSTDALGAGLLFFLLVVVLVALWGVWDGWRRGLPLAALVWLLVGAATGLGIPVASVALDVTTGSLGHELRDGWIFLALLVAVPAVVGAIPGGIAHRARSRP